ncbi:hypothetical protein ATSB10_34160 [Dyella thiooxydans]|uniref:Uncharacterized protein n=1 Tax=Dyella thiooxydans TaxID=445710 RepID=A0A160N4K6_9GAMM|nr:hypothetical protein ATSB10_34160 [Dyella thiooxydans]
MQTHEKSFWKPARSASSRVCPPDTTTAAHQALPSRKRAPG